MSESDEWTMSVPDAGKLFFGLGRSASYAAADRGDIPTIRIGWLRRANVKAIKRNFEQEPKTAA